MVLPRFEFKNIRMERTPIEEFFNLPAVPMQRDTIGRASKPKVKRMLRILKAPHLEVSLIELTKDCFYYGKKYKKGFRAIVNGNTRKHYWVNSLTNAVPTHVNSTIYYCDNMEEVRDIYNMFDNPDQSEKNQEKLYGILSGLYNYEPVSSKILKGEFLTALHFACYKLDPSKYSQANIKSEDLPFEVKEYIEEIKAFDSICFTPKNWDQALVCSALMCLKKYGLNNARLLELFDRIDKRKMDTTQAERDGATHICFEWDTGERFPVKGTSWYKPGGFSQAIPYILYWVEKFMAGKKQMQIGKGWENMADNWFTEYHTINSNLTKLLNSQSQIIEDHFQIEQTT